MHIQPENQHRRVSGRGAALVENPTPDLPAGFARAPGSGLILPEEDARPRQVWTKDEARLLQRATRLLESRGVVLFLGCAEPGCADSPLRASRAADGSTILRCAHLDRVLTRYK